MASLSPTDPPPLQPDPRHRRAAGAPVPFVWPPRVSVLLSAAVGLWLVVLLAQPETPAGQLLGWFVTATLLAAVALEGGVAWVLAGWPSTDEQRSLVRHVLWPLSVLPLAAVSRVLPIAPLPTLLGIGVAAAVAGRLAAALPASLTDDRKRHLALAGMVAVFLPGLLLFQTTVIHDAFQYHATAASMLFDRSYDTFSNLFFYNSHRSYNPYPEGSIRYLGVPLLEMPALIVGHAAALVLEQLGWGFAANGFSLPYLFWLSVTSSMAGVAAVGLTFVWVARRTGRRWAFAAVALLVWASALPMFVFLWHGWTHTYSILGAVLFLLQRDRALDARGRAIGQWYVLGVLAGVLCLIWPVNGLLLAMSVVDLMAAVRRGGGSGRAAIVQAVALLGGVFLGFLPQFAGWYGATGHWVGSTYGRVGDFFRWTDPAVLPLLFSWSQHGLLAWHPVLVPALLGLVLVRDRRLALGLAVWVVFQLYVLSCWSVWWTGIGFGNRFFLNLFPVAALGIAQVGAWAWRSRNRWDPLRRGLGAAVALVLVVFNVSLLNAYRSDVIPMGIKGLNYVQDDPPPLLDLARTLFVDVPLTPEFLTRDFWVNQSFFVSRLRTAMSGNDPGAWVSIGIAAAVILACWCGVLVIISRIVGARQALPATPVTSRAVPVSLALSATLLLVSTWLGFGVQPSPQGIPYLRFDAGETILRPGQKATFVPQGYLEPTREADLISFLTYAVFTPQGHVVAVLRLFPETGPVLEFPIVAGVHTAETSSYRSEVRPLMGHSSAQTTPVHEWMTRAYSHALYPAHAFVARFQLPEPLRIERVEIEMRHGGGDLVLRDVFLRG